MAMINSGGTAADLRPRVKPKVNLFAIGAVLLGSSIILAIFVSLGIGLREIRDVLAQVPLWLYVVLALTNGATILAGSIKWQLALHGLSNSALNVRLLPAVLATSVGVLFGQVMPIQIATTVARAIAGKRHDLPASSSIGSTAYEQLIELLVLVGMAMVAIPCLLFGAHWTALLASTPLLVAMPVVILRSTTRWLDSTLVAIARIAPRSLQRSIEAGHSAVRTCRTVNILIIVQLAVLSVLRHAIMIAGAVLTIRTLAPTLAVTDAVIAFPIVQLVAVLPMTPAGLGTAEMTWTGLLTATGIAAKQAAIVAFAVRLINLLGFLLFFALLLISVSAARSRRA
jgi:uncharacterized protein (TIRG00374 family)